jgi:hypothetical protein
MGLGEIGDRTGSPPKNCGDGEDKLGEIGDRKFWLTDGKMGRKIWGGGAGGSSLRISGNVEW